MVTPRLTRAHVRAVARILRSHRARDPALIDVIADDMADEMEQRERGLGSYLWDAYLSRMTD